MTITMFDPANPLAFFLALTRDFGAALAQRRGAPDLAAQLMQQVFAIFEENVACQCAGEAALRDAGLGWAIHEFVPALAIALREDVTDAWTKGGDPLAPSRAEDVSLTEMAATFDEIESLAR